MYIGTHNIADLTLTVTIFYMKIEKLSEHDGIAPNFCGKCSVLFRYGQLFSESVYNRFRKFAVLYIIE